MTAATAGRRNAPPATVTWAAGAARYWLVCAACFGLLLFRAWDRIVHADLFAEGVRFVGLALNDGWATLLEPYDMFFHTAPKLVALLAVNLAPVEAVPLFTNIACVATTAAAMAAVSRSAFRWLIPSDGARCVLALLMVLAPGLVEVLGNLAGLHWSLLLFLAVLSRHGWGPRSPSRSCSPSSATGPSTASSPFPTMNGGSATISSSPARGSSSGWRSYAPGT